jgi:hypothetical protein
MDVSEQYGIYWKFFQNNEDCLMEYFVAATDSVVFEMDVNGLFFTVILQVNWEGF